MKKKVIIIPVHNQLTFVQKCVKSVFANTKNFELIIVDDGSAEETEEWIRKNEKPLQYKRIRHEQAMGFSKSCNDGIDYAMENFDFTCLCLLNSDAEIVTNEWFDRVENWYDMGEKVGVAGVMSDNALAQTIKNIPLYLKYIDTKPTIFCNIVHGFCYFIGKELISTIGHLDGYTFPHYGSEDDYSLKAIKYGFKNIIVGSVFVKHNNETSYTHDVRAKFLKTTLPTLIKRWGRLYVNDCVVQANKAGQYLNEK